MNDGIVEVPVNDAPTPNVGVLNKISSLLPTIKREPTPTPVRKEPEPVTEQQPQAAKKEKVPDPVARAVPTGSKSRLSNWIATKPLTLESSGLACTSMVVPGGQVDWCVDPPLAASKDTGKELGVNTAPGRCALWLTSGCDRYQAQEPKTYK